MAPIHRPLKVGQNADRKLQVFMDIRKCFEFICFYFSGNIVDSPNRLSYDGFMILNDDSAASIFNQLGNVTRLKIVRALVRAGNTGMPVGEIRDILEIPNSTLSYHLRFLANVGLVRQNREGTVLRCFIDYRYIDSLVTFLTEECCSADPDYQP